MKKITISVTLPEETVSQLESKVEWEQANHDPDLNFPPPDKDELIDRALQGVFREQERRRTINEGFKGLTPREELVLRMYLGDSHTPRYSVKEIADTFSLSSGRIGQIKAQALKKAMERKEEFTAMLDAIDESKATHRRLGVLPPKPKFKKSKATPQFEQVGPYLRPI